MNDYFLMLGLESYKPALASLLLPPVPLLGLTVVGALLMPRRRGWAWLIIALATAALWFSASSAAGEWLQRSLQPPTLALGKERIAQLRHIAARPSTVVIVVLGGGRESLAPEYGVASLAPLSLERLRYGVWLARQTGAPLMFSGGLGHGQGAPGGSEAATASDIAAREFGLPLRWIETRSRDTRENARFTVAQLRDQNLSHLIVVTHGWHMRRALRAFQDAAAQAGVHWQTVPAPLGLAPRIEHPGLRWLPSSEGFQLVRAVLREQLGWWFGA
jgi:uncharacterized SAM-binding protein YcdF (DUF218 family)